MQVFSGKSVFGGIAIGKIKLFRKEEALVKRFRIMDTEAEYQRYQNAVEIAKKDLQVLYEKALQEVGEVNAMIFQVHQVMLDDLDYQEAVKNMIDTQNVNAEYAVAVTGDHFSKMFASMEDAYMRERAADVKDISDRLIKVLSGSREDKNDAEEPVILLAEDLAPSETVQLDKSMVLSFVTRKGSTNSHTAILARTMNIPAVIGVDFPDELLDGKDAIVDGDKGILYLEPDLDTRKRLEERQASDRQRQELLVRLKGKENITLDGRKIELFANIGTPDHLAAVMQNDAGGIGLFRSEFLYLESKDYPTEDEQVTAYKRVAETMAGKMVIIRTLDIGADKKVDYFHLDPEENPAMGYRAIRICLTREDIFRTQLRAIYRASVYGKIGIMYPMITSLEEVVRCKQIAASVKQELMEQGIDIGYVSQGIMIETPAAVMISKKLAKEVDFFSIGTNDLTQYTLAIDRQNPKLEDFYNPHHEAVLEMIRMTIENGHKEGCWVGICGELGADVTLTEQFIQMGVDELSVSPAMVLPVREAIRKSNFRK